MIEDNLIYGHYTLILGKQCNGACVYCHEGLNNTPYKIATIEDMPEPKTVAEYFPATGNYSLQLYGGEPLLYWDFIVKFLYEMKTRNPRVAIHVVTNGILLTVERAKILNEYGVGFYLSHDGHYYEQTRRSEDFLKTNPEPFLTMKDRKVSAVVSSLSPDFYQVWDYFHEFANKHGIQKPKVRIQNIKDVESRTPDFLFISDQAAFVKMLDRTFDNLWHNIRSGDFDCYEWYQYERWLNILKSRLASGERGVQCGVETNIIDIDVYGNLYHCHNYSESFSHVSKGIQPCPARTLPPSKCLNCDVLTMCGGLCPLRGTSSDDKQNKWCFVMYEQSVRVMDLYKKLGGTF